MHQPRPCDSAHTTRHQRLISVINHSLCVRHSEFSQLNWLRIYQIYIPYIEWSLLQNLLKENKIFLLHAGILELALGNLGGLKPHAPDLGALQNTTRVMLRITILVPPHPWLYIYILSDQITGFLHSCITLFQLSYTCPSCCSV